MSRINFKIHKQNEINKKPRVSAGLEVRGGAREGAMSLCPPAWANRGAEKAMPRHPFRQ